MLDKHDTSITYGTTITSGPLGGDAQPSALLAFLQDFGGVMFFRQSTVTSSSWCWFTFCLRLIPSFFRTLDSPCIPEYQRMEQNESVAKCYGKSYRVCTIQRAGTRAINKNKHPNGISNKISIWLPRQVFVSKKSQQSHELHKFWRSIKEINKKRTIVSPVVI